MSDHSISGDYSSYLKDLDKTQKESFKANITLAKMNVDHDMKMAIARKAGDAGQKA